jgi:N-acetylglucosaminyldiphosphoundecaprenol N-acetyl-beta-D-mannosaminyltransferase
MTDPAFASEPVREFSGCALSPLDFEAFFEPVVQRLRDGEQRLLLGHHNLHSLRLCQDDPDVRRFYRRCSSCYLDGKGALWLLGAAGVPIAGACRFSLMHRLPQLLELARSQRLSVYYLGSRPEVIELARSWIGETWPDLGFELEHGYFRDEESVVGRINRFQPDFLLVGMGMPRQERWIVRWLDRLSVGAVLQAGGTLDYYTGAQARPPEILGRIGMAWLYRLVRDPLRLWRRYLVEPWSLLRPTLRLRRRLLAHSKQESRP